jgi:hypothetical protein
MSAPNPFVIIGVFYPLKTEQPFFVLKHYRQQAYIFLFAAEKE